MLPDGGTTDGSTTGTELFDPADPRIIDDPYPAYARLRRQGPVYLESHDVWLITRYADVLYVVRHPELFSSRLGMGAQFGAAGQTGIGYRIGAPGLRVLIATDPPDHQHFRRAVAPAFSPGAVRAMQPRVTEMAEGLIDGLLERNAQSDADFFRDVAEPLPVFVLAEILGVPRDMRDDFRLWSRLITSELDQAAHAGDIGRGLGMLRYFREEIAVRRREGREDDLFGLLARPSEANLTDREILAFCAFLLVAGIETTTNLLTNLLAALTRFPEEWRRAQRDPDLVPGMIEEALRYDTSVQALWRAATEDADVGGVKIPAGARLLVMFAAANRDDTRFPDPDAFLIDRPDNDHLGFGQGPHYCLGGQLARMEMGVLMRALLSRVEEVQPRGDWERIPSVLLRGYTRQGVALRPR